MNDRQILGVDENYTLDDLKKAFRNKSKLFHPDRNKDSFKSHLTMIRVNQAYSNLLKNAPENFKDIKTSTKENIYSIYKDGIDKFRGIHPSKWKKTTKAGLFNAGAIETDMLAPDIIKSLIDNMAEAYLCFSIIVNEYPDSCWYTDSFEKMKEIEKMTMRYVKIMKSYESEMYGVK